MHAPGTTSSGAAPGKVFPSEGSQSPLPRIVGWSACTSIQPAHTTYLSPSPSVSLAGTPPLQALSLPSHTSGAPGRLVASVSPQSVPGTTGRVAVASPYPSLSRSRMQLSGPSIWAAPGKVRAALGDPSSQSVPGVTPDGGEASPQSSPSRSRMHDVGTLSLGAAPGKTVLSLARQSSPPWIIGLSF